MSIDTPTPRGATRALALALVLACGPAVVGVKLVEVGDAFTNLAGAALMALAAVLLAARAATAHGRERTVWALFAAAAGLNGAAEATWSVRDMMGIEQGVVSFPADAVYTASYPCAALGMWLLITAANRRGGRAGGSGSPVPRVVAGAALRVRQRVVGAVERDQQAVPVVGVVTARGLAQHGERRVDHRRAGVGRHLQHVVVARFGR